MPGTIVFASDLSNPHELLAQLAIRSAAAFAPLSSAPNGYPKLYVGLLPEEISLTIPLPSAARLVGSVLHSPLEAETYADAMTPPDETIAFYDDSLLRDGWNPPQTFGPGGFKPPPPDDGYASRAYCKGPDGPLLQIMAGALGESMSQVVVRFEAEPRAGCKPQAQASMQAQHQMMMSAVPHLHAPKRTWKTGGGGSGDANHWHSSAILETEMPLEQVMSHYASQLEQSGWTRFATFERVGTLASCWEVVDASANFYIGVFSVAQVHSRPGLRYLHLMLNRLDRRGDD